MIPHILSVFETVQSIRDELDKSKEELEAAQRSANDNGGSRKGSELIARSEAIGQMLNELNEQGLLVKDMDGLVDFPHIREGREVFLCWKLGETSVEHWHELETGFRGRQAL